MTARATATTPGEGRWPARGAAHIARGSRRRIEAAALRARNRSFRPTLRHDPGGPLLVLSPHLDDAALSCCAVLLREPDVRVANVFDGVPPAGFATRWDQVCGATDSAARAHERLAEDREALDLLGVVPVHLGFLDLEARSFAPAPSLAAIDAALSAAIGPVRGVVAPAGVGGHADHLTLRTYAGAIARAGVPVELYADLPYAVVHGWPHWVTGRVRDPHLDVDPYWESYLVGVEGLAPLREGAVVRLDEKEANRKLAALRTYRTQFRALDGGSVGVLTNAETRGFEVLWALTA